MVAGTLEWGLIDQGLPTEQINYGRRVINCFESSEPFTFSSCFAVFLRSYYFCKLRATRAIRKESVPELLLVWTLWTREEGNSAFQPLGAAVIPARIQEEDNSKEDMPGVTWFDHCPHLDRIISVVRSDGFYV